MIKRLNLRWWTLGAALTVALTLTACSQTPVVTIASPTVTAPARGLSAPTESLAATATPVLATAIASPVPTASPQPEPTRPSAPAPAVTPPAPQSSGPAVPVPPAPVAAAAGAPEQSAPGIAGVTAAAYAVMDAASGEVLAEYNGNQPRSPASLTKIMTALLVLERSGLDDMVTVPAEVSALRASTLMGVPPGERMSVRDLLYGLMLPSGNDAAVALAVHVAGNEPAFVNLMNQRALALGMRTTHFTNSHGLDFRDWGSPYTTAADLARVTLAALQIDAFRTIVATQSYTAHGQQGAYPVRNLNSFLGSYPGGDGVKIGWTRRAGQTIAASAVRGGRRLIAVALGSTGNRDGNARRLLDQGFRLATP